MDLKTNPFKGGGDDTSMAEPIADLSEKELNQLEESGTEEELDELNTTLERDGPGRDGSRPKDKSRSDITFSTHSTQDQDPLSFSNGPITRSKTIQLKEAILGLVYIKPISTSEENQVKEAMKLFNCSVFKIT